MITRLEIDGFKTFRNLAVDIAPFQVMVGPVGAGKSNLFDAITLLSMLADSDVRTAMQGVRGEPAELFTLFPDGSSLGKMRLAAEMLVEPAVEDNWGASADVKYTRMRYEVSLECRPDPRGVERFHVLHEELSPIQRSADAWARRFIGRGREVWLPTLKTGRAVPFISTGDDDRGETVFLHQDGRGGEMAAVAQRAERTVLSTISNTEFPHAYAAREEMRRWRQFELQPAAIRASGLVLPHSFIASDGGNLPAALARIQQENPALLEKIATEMKELAPELTGIDLAEGSYGRYRLRLGSAFGGMRSLAASSDATLRLLVIAALKNDPDAGGLLCLEEPENGLDRATIRRVAPYLCSVATDFAAQGETRLRQLLVATHSAALAHEIARTLSAREESPDRELPELLFVHRAPHADPWDPVTFDTTRFARIRPSQQLELELQGEEHPQTFTMAEVEACLSDRAD